jgi:hypothetical protein
MFAVFGWRLRHEEGGRLTQIVAEIKTCGRICMMQ